ncbi:TetR/AcrR family transcriptional regulator [Rhizobiaceae bacterium n13]|uniref:TetR/AcrR family transcriptional regulator n=1 Tax=Ferirhizobium litorale TaxID=2927786 RepID=A0AAE3U0T6_9HYPH|nr:TetR/AcrR family transcriptional regulator [Fererhizobium litorale]MDI7861525.1 TetR/AcrR family transcriptional regulator [Fererhizobium litorale]MDI7921671.1 TetR/AcrR family transcriptional regulator [Fererhizobium litorale]
MTNLTTTADEIVTCAHALMMNRGYNGFSYADVSETVGIRKASIHHHFPTKADLAVRVVAQYRKQVRDSIAGLSQTIPAPDDQLRAYVEYWESCVATGTQTFCVCAMLAAEIPALPENVANEVRAHFRDLIGWLASVIAAADAAGKARLEKRAEVEAEAFAAAIHGGMLAARAFGSADAFRSAAHTALDRILVPIQHHGG